MSTANDDAEQRSDVGALLLTAARLGDAPPACRGEELRQ